MTQTQKIAFVLPAMTAGGAERVLITLMNSLNRARYEPALISVSAHGPMAELIAPDIPFHCLDKNLKMSLPTLHKKLKTLEPDIIISTMAPMNFLLLLLRPFFPKTKFIVREAITPSFFLEHKKALRFFIKKAYEFLYRRADLVLAPAQMILDELENLGLAKDKMAVLPNPADLDKIRKPVKLPPRQSESTVHFISAGRLHPQKNYAALITALTNLNHTSWQLTILGEGEERTLLESLIAKHDLKENIFLPGHSAEPWPLIAGCDAFLLPSLYEGLPNVALESLACGTQVIAMKSAGGITEIAQNVQDKNDLQIADNMDVFVKMMNTVEAKPVNTHRPSKLPSLYEKENIVQAFEKLLESVST